MASFTHFLLTVFNVRLRHGGEVTPDHEWLEHRFRLFEMFCYPSVKAQSVKDFTWLVFFDSSTPREFRERIQGLPAMRQFVPCFVSEVMSIESFAGMKDSLFAPHLRPGTTHLITSNLDNDDALHSHYVENVQKEFSAQDFEFLNFTRGFLFDREKERLFVRKHLSNPFVSLVERFENARTEWCAPHTEISKLGPVRQVNAEPMWLQVIHGRNVSNTIADAYRVPLVRLDEGFEAVRGIARRHESRLTIALANISLGLRAVAAHVAGR